MMGRKFYSHIGQDMWVAQVFRSKKSGFFLDFGAFDGVTASNTFALERDLRWRGILVEPNPTYYPTLCRYRRSIAVNAALWPDSRLAIEMLDAHGLSSMRKYAEHDGASVSKSRMDVTQRTVTVDTINPTELIGRFSAPELIEYMSLDVEGCEVDVLQSLDLKKYKIALITAEHSEVAEKQEEIRSILLPMGYRVFSRFYDDWFYNPQHVEALGGNVDVESSFEFVKRKYAVKDLEVPVRFPD